MNLEETQKLLTSDMERWMAIENSAVASTTAIIKSTPNPAIRMMMEIIAQDSLTHYRVQEFIRDSLSEEQIGLTAEELVDTWVLIERHLEIERKTVETAQEALSTIKDKNMVVQEYLLNYLLMDEKKHDSMLANLETIKRGLILRG